jgi:hypothetical protein
MIENRESGMWVPASEHRGDRYDDEDEEEEEDSTVAEHSIANGETRGREEERVAA